MLNTCAICEGTYITVQPDGSPYFHACGPIPNPAFNNDPAKGPVDLRETIERPNKVDQNVKQETT